MELTLHTILIIITASSLAGILAGMLGIGGGIIIVPMLYYLLTYFGYEQSIVMHIAVGTSLFIIIPTGFRSAIEHSKRNSFNKEIFNVWAPPIAIGAAIGSYLAGLSSFKGLTILFAILAMILSIQMFINSRREMTPKKINHPLLKISPFFIGLLSSMIGIGGGNLSVPIMNYMGIDVRRAIGTSSALGIVIAIPGSIGFMISGYSLPGLPVYSLGYVNFLFAILIVPMTFLFVPLGVKLAHIIPRNQLQRIFSLLLVITAIKMFWDLI